MDVDEALDQVADMITVLKENSLNVEKDHEAYEVLKDYVKDNND